MHAKNPRKDTKSLVKAWKVYSMYAKHMCTLPGHLEEKIYLVCVQHMSGFPYTTAIYVHVKMALILFVSSLTPYLPSPHPPHTEYQSEWWSEAENESGTGYYTSTCWMTHSVQLTHM